MGLRAGKALALAAAVGEVVGEACAVAAGSPLHVQAAVLAGLTAMGAAIYFAVAFGIGGADLGMIRRNIRRGAASSDEPGIAPPD